MDGSAGSLLVKVISDLRTKKVESKTALSAEVKGALVQNTEEVIAICQANEWLIKNVLHIGEIEYAVGEINVELRR